MLHIIKKKKTRQVVLYVEGISLITSYLALGENELNYKSVSSLFTVASMQAVRHDQSRGL